MAKCWVILLLLSYSLLRGKVLFLGVGETHGTAAGFLWPALAADEEVGFVGVLGAFEQRAEFYPVLVLLCDKLHFYCYQIN